MQWVENSPILYAAINPEMPPTDYIFKGNSNLNIVKNSDVCTKTFDLRKKIPNNTRRTRSSFSKPSEINYLVVVEGVPVTKLMMLNYKKIYDDISKKGKCTGKELCKGLMKINLQNFKNLKDEKIYSNFKDFISDLYQKAGIGQIERMLGLINGIS